MGMEIQKIAQCIQSKNKNDWNKVILAFIGFIGFDFLIALMSGSNDLSFLLIGQCILVVTALEVGRYQWNRYLYVDEMILGARKSLYEVTRMQAFPVKEYFAYVNKKMVIPAVVLGICSVLIGVLGATAEEGKPFAWETFFIMLCFGVVNVLCQFWVGIWKKKFFLYQSKMGTKGKLNMAHIICGKMFAVVEVLFLICVALIATIFLWVIIIGVFSPNIDETIVVLHSYPYSYSFILIIIAVFVALWVLSSGHNMKTISKAAGAISFIFFIASLIVLAVEVHIYTEFTYNQITVRQLWDTKTYEIKDVKRFIIYDKDDAIQMKLYFDDENFTKISGSTQTYSKLYEKTYYSDYNFIADYIELLQENGAVGQLEDVKKLQKDVADLAPQCKSGLEEIIQLMK
jgi:hypothetical protein